MKRLKDLIKRILPRKILSLLYLIRFIREKNILQLSKAGKLDFLYQNDLFFKLIDNGKAQGLFLNTNFSANVDDGTLERILDNKDLLYLVKNNEIDNLISEQVREKEIIRRIDLPLTDLSSLSAPVPPAPPYDPFPFNWFYCLSEIYKRHAGLNISYSNKAACAHMIMGRLNETEAHCGLPVILVYGEHLARQYREVTESQVIPVGPPISYVSSLYSDKKIMEEKKRLGRNALIFPMHSTDLIKIRNSMEHCLEIAEKVKPHYDTIRFCLYFKDILWNMCNPLAKSGYECITAGNSMDYFFYSRQKAMISIADHTYSDAFTSANMFSVAMETPTTIFPHEIEFELTPYPQFPNQETYKSHLNYQKNIMSIFNKDLDYITEEQAELVRHYMGTDKVKSPAQMREILFLAERLYREKYDPQENMNKIFSNSPY